MGKLQNNQAGFSLTEVLIVIAVVAILATLSISNMLSSRAHAQLERGEIQVSNTLKEARNIAVSEECNTRVVFDEAGNTMTTGQQDNETLTWTQVGAVQDLEPGIFFVSGSNTLPSTTASFTPRGTLVAGGEFVISNHDAETSTFIGNIVTGKFPVGGGNLR